MPFVLAYIWWDYIYEAAKHRDFSWSKCNLNLVLKFTYKITQRGYKSLKQHLNVIKQEYWMLMPHIVTKLQALNQCWMNIGLSDNRQKFNNSTVILEVSQYIYTAILFSRFNHNTILSHSFLTMNLSDSWSRREFHLNTFDQKSMLN